MLKKREAIEVVKKLKLTIEITDKDLELLEDHMFVIPVCKEHKKLVDNMTEKEAMGLHYWCPGCEKEYQKAYKGAKRIVIKLFKAESSGLKVERKMELL